MLVTVLPNDTEEGCSWWHCHPQGLKMGWALAVAGRSLGCDQPEQDRVGEVWLQALTGMALVCKTVILKKEVRKKTESNRFLL